MYLPTCCDIAVIFWCKKKGRMSITYWPCFNACKRWLSTLLHSKRVAQPCWIKQSHCSLIPFIPETRHSPVTYSFLTHSYHKTAVSKTHQSELYLVWQLARLFFFFSLPVASASTVVWYLDYFRESTYLNIWE